MIPAFAGFGSGGDSLRGFLKISGLPDSVISIFNFKNLRETEMTSEQSVFRIMHNGGRFQTFY